MCYYRPYWIRYKCLKRDIKKILKNQDRRQEYESKMTSLEISNLLYEREFFKDIKAQLLQCNIFFTTSEISYELRYERLQRGFVKIKNISEWSGENSVAWSTLLRACVNLYKDGLLLQNFATMNYCGFSKILKKHDKNTGFVTRDAFMRNYMSKQNITHFPKLLGTMRKVEILYLELRNLFRLVNLLMI